MSMTITSVSRENRVFEPPASFSEKARVRSRARYDLSYQQSLIDPQGFWREQAEHVQWFRAPTKVREGELPRVTWFEDGLLNASTNCLDRHVASPRRHKAAIVWEGESGEVRTLSYQDLQR